MANIEKKLLLFLSDPQFTNEEVNKIKKILGSDDFYSKVKSIRSILSKKKKDSSINKFNKNISDYQMKIIEEIEKLLLKEANLNVEKSIKYLEDYLHTLSPDKRKSFKDQILLFIKNEGGSEVINAAHKIRNDIVHSGDKSAWPLRDNK